MSSKAVLMGAPGSQSVEKSSQLLKRLFLVERELMRSLGGYLVNIADWELKKIIPHHLWQDATRAHVLRSRILEMRYPRRDVDTGFDPPLETYLNMLIRNVSDAEFVDAVYLVTKVSLYNAYVKYLDEADVVDDAPTIEIINSFLPQLRAQITEVQQMGTHDSSLPRTPRGRQVQAHLQSIGGLLGTDEIRVDTIVDDRPQYAPPKVPARDPRFLNAVYASPPRQAENFAEQQVWIAIDQVNEIWASEITALAIWKWNHMPWDFYLDLARWSYDEARHCMMGERRLKSWGFETGIDYPIYAEHWVSQADYGELAILGLLHRFEVDGPAWKHGLKISFEAAGDTSSSQDFDYDWADESIHLMYGHKWLLRLVDDDLDAMERLKEEVYDRWNEWFKDKCKQWDYQPFMNRIHQRIIAVERAQRTQCD